jgi:hypothetical protein
MSFCGLYMPGILRGEAYRYLSLRACTLSRRPRGANIGRGGVGIVVAALSN